MTALRVLFRCDGNAEIGSGHLMRCFGLAQHIAEAGGTCALLTAHPDAPAVAWWRAETLPIAALPAAPYQTEDAQATHEAAAGLTADWIVVDGYNFTDAFHHALARQHPPYLYFDDACRDVPADLVVNQNAGAERRCGAVYGERALLGCAYVMLRRELRQAAKPQAGAVPHVLISFGGYDPENLALAAAQALAATAARFSATLVCAADAASFAATQAWARRQSQAVDVVAPGDIAGAMARSDLALCAGGTTSLEFAALGVPSVIVVRADNQRDGAAYLAQAGCAVLAGEGKDAAERAGRKAATLLADPAARRAMAAAGRRLVDGRGAERVMSAMARRAGQSLAGAAAR
ncbi:MAG: UDP-2,4-diacetamido-2,4,6-trideoxy-beta-L-altropyranose hydrolase [Alphaproteobacteria bacterium]